MLVHGTLTAYGNYGCRCSPCKRSNTQYYQRYRKNGRQGFHYSKGRKSNTEYSRLWYKANPERGKAIRRNYVNARRAKMKSVDKITLFYDDILRNDPCCYCGAPSECVDHIDPVKRGGKHSWFNLTSSCNKCNGRKRVKSLLGFLVEEAV